MDELNVFAVLNAAVTDDLTFHTQATDASLYLRTGDSIEQPSLKLRVGDANAEVELDAKAIDALADFAYHVQETRQSGREGVQKL